MTGRGGTYGVSREAGGQGPETAATTGWSIADVVLGSRFLLGKACANPFDEVPDEIGFNLMRHCYSEFSYLAQFLPSLYYAENGREPAPRLW